MTALPALTLYDFPAHPGVPGPRQFLPFVSQVERALKLAQLPFKHTR